MPGTRVLCYSPYGRWELHAMWELTILHAARLRGAAIDLVTCDGLFSNCDQFWERVHPRPAHACTHCQAAVSARLASAGRDFIGLGRFVTRDEHRRAREWADALAPGGLLAARLDGWDIGAWVRGSVQSALRANEPDVEHDPEAESIARGYCFSGAVAAFALSRLLAEARPDVMLLFNGRQSSTRIALELARRDGVRVLVHERGRRPETLALVENRSILSLTDLRAAWNAWREVPMDPGEVEEIGRLIANRAHGRDLPWTAFTNEPQRQEEVRAALGLADGTRPLWLLLTSSDDEVSNDPDWSSPFPSQRDWIERVVAHARSVPAVDLVVRVHPNTGSARSSGRNADQLRELRELGRDLPANVRIVQPDEEISTYTLMDMATVGFTWVSVAGLEMACRGKQVVVASGCAVHGTEFVRSVTPENLDGTIAGLHELAPGAVDPEIRRLALRFAHLYFFRSLVPFPLVEMTTHTTGALRYGSPDELVPGRDPGLDRAVDVLLDGAPVIAAPSDRERRRPAIDEDRAIASLVRRPITAIAFADELVADPTLLEAWGAAFEAGGDATLIIQTRPDQTDALIAAVHRARMDGDDAPPLMAVDALHDPGGPPRVDVVFSRRAPAAPYAGTVRVDPEHLASWAEAAAA